jgi:hypothetical protein
MKLSKLKIFLLCSVLLVVTFLVQAQNAAFLVPDRIEAEIIKDEIKALDKKDASYKSKLAGLQKQQTQAESKALALEEVLIAGLNQEKNSTQSSFNYKDKSGATVVWRKTSDMKGLTSGNTVPRPPGGRPCLPGACLDFLLVPSEDDYSNYEKVREVEMKGRKYKIYKIKANQTSKIARYTISANQYARN